MDVNKETTKVDLPQGSEMRFCDVSDPYYTAWSLTRHHPTLPLLPIGWEQKCNNNGTIHLVNIIGYTDFPRYLRIDKDLTSADSSCKPYIKRAKPIVARTGCWLTILCDYLSNKFAKKSD